MKKMTLFLFLISSVSFAQKTHLYFGLKAPHSIHAELNFQHKEDARFGASISYYIPYFNRMYYYAGGIIPIDFVVHGLNQKGFSFGLNYGLLSYSKEGKWHTFQVEYQRLKSGEYIYDEGKWAGTSEESYDEFTDKYNNISLIYGIRKALGKHKRFEFFYEFGFTLRFIQRHYSVEGTLGTQIPSDRTENKIDAMPMGRIGFNIRVF